MWVYFSTLLFHWSMCLFLCQCQIILITVALYYGLSWWLRGRESACHAGDASLIPGSRRSPGGGNGKPLQYSCLKNPTDRGAWWSTVQKVAKSQTWQHAWAPAALYCSLKSRYMIPLALFFLKIVLTVHGLLCYKFYNCFSSAKNASGILIGIALNLYIALVGLVILKILTLLIHEHSIFFHLFVLSSVSFLSVS